MSVIAELTTSKLPPEGYACGIVIGGVIALVNCQYYRITARANHATRVSCVVLNDKCASLDL